MRLYLKKTLHKKGQVEEWLRVQALSSNPSITKKKKGQVIGTSHKLVDFFLLRNTDS
jgi:hypothetical protein